MIIFLSLDRKSEGQYNQFRGDFYENFNDWCTPG